MNPRSVSTKVPPGFSERLAPPERVLADRVEHDVVRLAVLREVLLQVVDDLVGAERATSSTFFVLQTAVTWAPKCLASCTAAVPTDPEAP